MMEMDMTEINFIYMHKTVVSEVISRTAITKSIQMLKLNSVVKRQSTVEPQQDEEAVSTEPTPCTSVTSKWKSSSTPAKRGKKRKHAEVSDDMTVRPQPSHVPDVVYIPKFKEVATQTVTEQELLTQEEEYFERVHIEHVRQLLTVDFIKEEDFDEEYPASEHADE